MSLNTQEAIHLAKFLDEARLKGQEVDCLTQARPLTLEEAYEIQQQGIALRLARGEKIRGFKMGLTSEAKRAQMGLHTPVYGQLTDRMEVRSEEGFSFRGSIHPKIEPEIALITASEIRQPLENEEAAFRACRGFCAALEILDSRYRGFKYFSLPDVVADNSSAAHFVLGQECAMPSRWEDLSEFDLNMKIDGKTAESASASAVDGNPIRSLMKLSALLAAKGLVLPAGTVILTGAATAAVALEMGMKVELVVSRGGGSQKADVGSVQISVG